MGLIIISIWAVYIFALIILVGLVHKFISKKLWVNIVIIIFALLVPTYDIILTNILGSYYCSQEPNPKTFIKNKVEYPESIYWEDNVYPGFNEEDRKLMITNYLDGEHLKKIALNGDDEKVYVYEIDKNIFKDLKYDKKYKNIYEQYAQIILKTQKIYTKQTMPKMNYTVTFNEVELHSFARKFIYSDETKIKDNKTNEVIAQNHRLMKLFYNILPDLAGGRYYQNEEVCGESYYSFEDKLFTFNHYLNTGKQAVDINKYLYKKYIKGER